jgi:hypothetical protein
VQDHVGAARGFGDGVVVERVDLDDPDTRRRARRAAGPDQTRDRPAGGAECLRRLGAEPAGRAEYQDARGHERRQSWWKGMGVIRTIGATGLNSP